MRRTAFIGILFFLFGLPLLALADAAPSTGALQLNMTPQYPNPGDTVTITAADYTGNADSMTYVWSVDGNVVEEGIGEKTMTLTAGPAGSSQTVDLSVGDGETVEDSATAVVRPADIDLIWEGDTYVPPFYIGRPLPNSQSQITILAIPHIVSGGSDIPPNSLIYSWKENGVPLASGSGYGDDSIVITPPTFGEPFTISVNAETTDGTGVANASINITPQQPQVAIYEDDPLLGILFEKKAPTTFLFTQQEASFAAFPVFVSNPSVLTYQWTLDGKPFSVDPTQPGLVTFRETGAESGSHSVIFSFKNSNKFLENASASFNLSFNN